MNKICLNQEDDEKEAGAGREERRGVEEQHKKEGEAERKKEKKMFNCCDVGMTIIRMNREARTDIISAASPRVKHALCSTTLYAAWGATRGKDLCLGTTSL